MSEQELVASLNKQDRLEKIVFSRLCRNVRAKLRSQRRMRWEILLKTAEA